MIEKINFETNIVEYKIAFSIINKGGPGKLLAIGEVLRKDTTIITEKNIYLELENILYDTLIFPNLKYTPNREFQFQLLIKDSIGNFTIP